MSAPIAPYSRQYDYRTPPEERLVFSILSQAVSDLFGSHSILTPAQRSRERRLALVFLTATSGEGYAWRAHYCSLVDVDPDVLRAGVIAILEGRREPNLPYDSGFTDGLIEARSMWAAQRPRPTDAAKRLPTDPAPPLPALPRIIPKVDKVAAAKAKVFAHLHQPIRQIDILNALAQDLSHHEVMKILKEGIERGEVVRNQDRRYRLAA